MKPEISIIIPCFNGEQYILRALSSIITKEPEKIEIVIIDDCSTDKTAEVIQKYSEHEPNITYVRNKHNLGAGGSRNVGIKLASGNYLMFLDCDDTLSNSCVDELLKASKEDSDLVLFDTQTSKKGRKGLVSAFSCTYIEEPIDPLIAFVFIRGGICGKMVKKEIIQKNNIEFGEMHIAEDFLFMKRIALHSRSIQYIRYPHYIYNLDNSNSLMHKHSKDFSNYELESFNKLKLLEKSEKLLDELNSIYFLEVVYGFNARILLGKLKFKKKRSLFIYSTQQYNKNDKYYSLYPKKYRVIYTAMKLLYLH